MIHEEDKQIQRHNLFHIYLIVQVCRVLTIIDSENNLVSSDLVEKLGLTTRQHSYHINFNGSIIVVRLRYLNQPALVSSQVVIMILLILMLCLCNLVQFC